jgi:hypothetical protein
MIVGTEENQGVLQLIQAVRTKICNTAPTKYIVQVLLACRQRTGGDGKQHCDSDVTRCSVSRITDSDWFQSTLAATCGFFDGLNKCRLDSEII